MFGNTGNLFADISPSKYTFNSSHL